MLLAQERCLSQTAPRALRPGASFDQTLKTLGIFEQMAAKITRAQGGAGAMEMLAKGEVEIGLTFLSEIHDPGVEVCASCRARVQRRRAGRLFSKHKRNRPRPRKRC